MRTFLIGLMVGVMLGSTAMGQEAGDFDARTKKVLSKLQAMGHGTYSRQEWAEVEQSVNDLMKDAAQRQDGDAIIQAAVIKAMVLSDMRRQHEPAIQVLRQALATVRKMPDVDASRLYVKMAEVEAEAGNPAGVEAVIKEYKAGPYYDPKPYQWYGLSEPGEPLMVARPGATEGDSLPLTIMEKALVRAKSAPGILFPDAVLTDLQGRQFRLSSFRGKVVLVDFFARGWRVWEENLPQLRETWSRYHPQGFEVVSICLERSPANLTDLGLPWWVVPEARDLSRSLGIFGSSTSYLLNADGRVIARDLRGQDLAFAVRRALGR